MKKSLALVLIFFLAFSGMAFAAIPTTPTGLTGTSSANQMSLNWDDEATATSYTVYRDGVSIATPATSNYIDTSVVEGTSYDYTITASNVDGESAPTAALTLVGTSSVSFSSVALPFTVADMLGTAVNFLAMYGEWILLALGVIFAPVLYGLAMKLVAAVKKRTAN